MQLARLGDMICTTPMLRAIKEKYPEAKLYVMGDGVNREILANNKDVDGYIVWDKKNFFKLRKILRFENFDFAALTGPGPEALALLYLSDIPFIVSPILEDGYSPLRTRSYWLLSKLVATRPHKLGRYAPREYLRLLEVIGIFTDNTEKHLAYSEFGQKKVSEFFMKNSINIGNDLIVGIFPSTGNKIKLWGREKFAKVADWLYKNHKAKIILIGSESDRAEINELISYLSPETKVINSLNLFNIDELKMLISKMNMMISVDSGPIYIAEAFGVPTIDIVGPVDEKDQPPVGEIHKVVVADRKKPEMGVFNARVYNEREARRQSEEISAEMVIEKIKELILLIKK